MRHWRHRWLIREQRQRRSGAAAGKVRCRPEETAKPELRDSFPLQIYPQKTEWQRIFPEILRRKPEAAAETGLPDWLEAQLTPEQAVQAESKILEQLRETGKERRRVLILGVIFGALALVTAAAGAALLAASKKRRSKHVRF